MSKTSIQAENTCSQGDVDPTPWGGPFCDLRDPDLTFHCTRRPLHEGQHVAGNGERVAAVWGR